MKSLPKSFLFHSLVYWAGKMFARSISIILLPIITIHIGPSEYGVLSILGIMMDVFMLVLCLQLPSAIYRFWANAKTNEEKSIIMSSSLVVTVCFPLVCLLPFYLWAEPFAYLIDIKHVNLFRLVLFEVQVGLILAIFLTDMRIHDESRLYASIEIFQNLAIGAFTIFFVVYMGWGITGMIIAQTLVFSLITICCAPRFFRRVTTRVDVELMKQMIGFAIPLIPAAVAMAAVHTSDRIFIQQIIDNAAAGIYAIGYKFGMLVSFLITGPFLLIWEPKSFEIAQEEGSAEKYGEIFTLLVVGVSFVAVLLTGMSQEIIFFMVDEEYNAAYKVIPWIAWSYVFFAMAMVVRVGLLVGKKTLLSAWIVFFVFLVNVVGNLVMIPINGVVGAAMSTLLAFVVYFVVNLICSHRYIPIKFELKKILILCVLVFGATLIMGQITVESIMFSTCCKSVVALCLLCSFFLFGFFEKFKLQAKARAIFLRIRS